MTVGRSLSKRVSDKDLPAGICSEVGRRWRQMTVVRADAET
jgi:hypothetical protein